MRRDLLTWAVVLLTIATASTVWGDAPECDPGLCNDSTCRCSGPGIPQNITAEKTPQFIVLSFDDGITITNYPFYENLGENLNPNGCKIRMTFFVSHENTDYTLVNKLHRLGHEISTHSVSALAEVDTYWRNMTEELWINEINDMKTMLMQYGNIPAEDITGFRAPFLEVGGNLMFKVLHDSGFEYDSSWPTLEYTTWSPDPTTAKGGMFPYTLDYFSVQDQTVGTKPTDSFPGLWENPMTDMQDNRGEPCPMLDLCLSVDDELETSANAVFDLLRRNFLSHYNTDRSPFGLYTRQAWFLNDDITNSTARHDGFQMFMEYVSGFPDTYVVTVDQLVQWTRNPVSTDDIDSFEPLQCLPDLPADTCPDENHINCHYVAPLPIAQSEIYMNICQSPCPASYPWTGNPDGNLVKIASSGN